MKKKSTIDQVWVLVFALMCGCDLAVVTYV